MFVFAQTNTDKKITFGGYGELYYSYDFSNPSNHEKANFIFNHKRHNEINANLILAKANYLNKTIRANLGFMLGNYAQYNLSSEPTWAQYVYEANIGVKVSKKANIWLDAGILPSHIGFESAVGSDCWTVTRSILAENSPYYETGARLTYTGKNEKLNLAFLVLNGWQRIKKPDNIQKPSFGMQVNFKASDKLVLNYSNFLGTDKADSLDAFRVFHNFYFQFEPNKKFGLIGGFDIGTDKYNSNDYGMWFSPVIIARFSVNDKANIAVRGEYFNDKKQIIILTNTQNGFQVAGISANFDYILNDNLKFRVEGKLYYSKDKIFNNSSDNYSFTTNICLKL